MKTLPLIALYRSIAAHCWLIPRVRATTRSQFSALHSYSFRLLIARSPKLPPPSSDLFRLDQTLQDQIPLGLEKVDLAFVQHLRVDSPYIDSMVCKMAFR